MEQSITVLWLKLLYVTALLEYLNLPACFMLASGYSCRLSIKLIVSSYVLQWWNNHKPLLLQWAATDCQENFRSAAIFLSAAVQRLVNSGFTYQVRQD